MNDIKNLLSEIKGLESAIAIMGERSLKQDEEIYFKMEDDKPVDFLKGFSPNAFLVNSLHRVAPITITAVFKNRPISVTVLRYNHMRNKNGKSGQQFDLFYCKDTVLDKDFYELFFPGKEHEDLNAILENATLGHNGINIKKPSHKKNDDFIKEVNKALRPYYLTTIKAIKGREIATVSKTKKDKLPTFLAIYSVLTTTE